MWGYRTLLNRDSLTLILCCLEVVLKLLSDEDNSLNALTYSVKVLGVKFMGTRNRMNFRSLSFSIVYMQ